MRFPLARTRRAGTLRARHDTTRRRERRKSYFFFIMIIISPVLETRIAPFPRDGRQRVVSSFIRFDVYYIHNTRSARARSPAAVMCVRTPHVHQSHKNVLYRFVIHPSSRTRYRREYSRMSARRPLEGVPERAGAFNTVDPGAGATRPLGHRRPSNEPKARALIDPLLDV